MTVSICPSITQENQAFGKFQIKKPKIEPTNIIQNVPKPISPTEKDIIQSAEPIITITPEANPLTPSIKFIEFEIPADAKTVKHIAIKGSARIGVKIVKSTSSNHRPVK